MSKLHYHPKTQTFFNLHACEWCGGDASTDAVGATGSHIEWTGGNVPPEMLESEERGCTICLGCKGVVFYIEPIKSEHAIIKRPNQEYVDGKKSRKADEQLCKELNDNVNGIAHPDTSTDLTTETDGAKLADMIVIRLGSTIDDMFKRGVHLEIPIEEFMNLIKQNGVKPMAKNTERKTAKELIRSLIIKKKTDVQILAEVEKLFPESNADKKHCTKYRRELFVEEAVGVELAAVGSREHQEYGKANLAVAKRGPHKDYWGDYDNKQKASVKAEKEKAAAAKKAKADKAKEKVEADKVKKAAATKKAKTTKTPSKSKGTKVAAEDPLD